MNRRRGRVALVDSPFQLLSLFEAIDAGIVDPPHTLITRGKDVTAVQRLGAPLVTAARLMRDPAPSTLVRLVASSTELVAGDPYSTLVHAVATTSRTRRLTLVDDGAATLRALDTLAGGADGHLIRAHAVRRRQRAMARLGGAALDRLAAAGRVTLSTGLPITEPQRAALVARGYVVARHDFGWARQVPVIAAIESGESIRNVVLGSSLAHDGLVERDFYQRWLRSALGGEATLFVPHRRDLGDVLDLAAASGAVTYTPAAGLPVELVVRDLADGVTVHTLPSTAALTIPAIRAGRDTRMRCTLPPDEAVTSRCTPTMRDLQRRIQLHAS